MYVVEKGKRVMVGLCEDLWEKGGGEGGEDVGGLEEMLLRV